MTAGILYAFQCSAAGHEVEAFFPFGESPEYVTCPDHEAPARRIIARGTFSRVPGGHDLTYKRT